MLRREDGWESNQRRELVVVACFPQLWLVLRTTSQLWRLKEGKRAEQKLSEFPVLARGTRSRTRRKIAPEKHSFPAFRWYELLILVDLCVYRDSAVSEALVSLCRQPRSVCEG